MDVAITQSGDSEAIFLHVVNVVLFIELVDDFMSSLLIDDLQIEVVNVSDSVGV